MNKYYEVCVRYRNAINKIIKSNFIVEALSFADAEAKAYNEVACYASSDAEVLAVKRSNVEEIVSSNAQDYKFFKVKYSIINVDEKSGKEKKTARYILFQADSIDGASDMYYAAAKSWVSDIVLESISETKLVDYLK